MLNYDTREREITIMDLFHKANIKHVDGMDYNAHRYCKRGKKDGQMLRKVARTRLKRNLKEEVAEWLKAKLC